LDPPDDILIVSTLVKSPVPHQRSLHLTASTWFDLLIIFSVLFSLSVRLWSALKSINGDDGDDDRCVVHWQCVSTFLKLQAFQQNCFHWISFSSRSSRWWQYQHLRGKTRRVLHLVWDDITRPTPKWPKCFFWCGTFLILWYGIAFFSNPW